MANIIQYSATDVEQGLKRTRDLVRVRQTPGSGCLNAGIDGYVESEVWPRHNGAHLRRQTISVNLHKSLPRHLSWDAELPGVNIFVQPAGHSGGR